jgi:hypothetical protein
VYYKRGSLISHEYQQSTALLRIQTSVESVRKSVLILIPLQEYKGMKGFVASLLVSLAILLTGYPHGASSLQVHVSEDGMLGENEIVVEDETEVVEEGYIVAEPYYLPPPEENTCDGTSDCETGYYCSTSGQCKKPGQCATDNDCLNPFNDFPGNNGDPSCFSECEISEGTCLTACYDAELPPDLLPNSSLECANDEACGDGKFCVRGECQRHGTCIEDIDCKNPSNSYMTTKCVGYVSCKEGACARTCSSSGCPEGESEVRCFAQPCRVSCPESVVCVDDYCGGCNAIHFDAAGHRVCGL